MADEENSTTADEMSIQCPDCGINWWLFPPATVPPRPWDQITDTTKESFATFERELRKNVAENKVKSETTTEWLKRDPKNGMLLGPDGCHYSNEHQAAHFGLLHLCGCGCPDDAYNFCRGALDCFDRRGAHTTPPTRDWINAEDALTALVQKQPNIAAHVLAHLLSHLDLLEHGGSVGGSWLTPDGERIIDMGPMTESLMDDET